MIVHKVYRYQIYPMDIQDVFFDKTFGCVRFIYNVMHYDKIQHFENSKTDIQNITDDFKRYVRRKDKNIALWCEYGK